MLIPKHSNTDKRPPACASLTGTQRSRMLRKLHPDNPIYLQTVRIFAEFGPKT